MKRLRPPRLSYANIVATLALFLALAGGTAFAAVQLGKGSVGSKHLKKNAVTSAKVKNGSLRAVDFAETSRGVALAGVSSEGGGTNPAVSTYFNRLGGQPTIEHPAEGRYVVTIPGLSAAVNSNVVVVGNSSQELVVSVTSSEGKVVVHVLKNVEVFEPADGPFSILIFGSSPSG